MGAGRQDGNGLIHRGQQRPQGQADLLTDESAVLRAADPARRLPFRLRRFLLPSPHCGEHCYPPFPLPGASAPKLWGHFPAETQLCVLITPRVRERGEGQRLAEERTPGVRGGAPGPSPSPLVLPGSEGPARRCRRGHPPRLLRPASRDSPARPSALHERQCRRLLRSLEVVCLNRKHQRPCR